MGCTRPWHGGQSHRDSPSVQIRVVCFDWWVGVGLVLGGILGGGTRPQTPQNLYLFVDIIGKIQILPNPTAGGGDPDAVWNAALRLTPPEIQIVRDAGRVTATTRAQPNPKKTPKPPIKNQKNKLVASTSRVTVCPTAGHQRHVPRHAGR